MKIWILLISVLSGAGVWHWAARRHVASYPPGISSKIKLAGRSVVAGVIVYFTLLLAAVTYLNWLA